MVHSLKKLFYIYCHHTITGPYNHHQIFQLYVADKITDTIWIKNAQYAQEKGEWCEVSLAPITNDVEAKIHVTTEVS